MTLLERMLRQNPWWQGSRVEEIENYKERFLIKEVEKYLKDPQMLAILGLRRTGKSVLLAQIIRRLLSDVPAKSIFYFSFDELLAKEPDIVERLIEAYENEVLKSQLQDVYIFFDEINHIQDWQVTLKRYYDLKRRIKFFVSGSSSIYLKKAKESLAGRIYEFTLPPLDFKEYLYLRGIEIKDLSLERLELKKELNKYFLCGALPEIINEPDFAKIKKYIMSVVDKVIFYDIPKAYGVQEPEILKIILSFIAQKPGMLLEYQSLASALKVSYQTVSKYVGYLEKAFLIKVIYNFRGSPIARARKLKKAYLGSHNLAAGFLDSENELMGKLPQLAENLVCLHLDAKWFWKKYTEVDFYHNQLPLEVKYTETMPDIKNALLAAEHLRSIKLFIVTKDIEQAETRQGIEVLYTPLWKYLLSS